MKIFILDLRTDEDRQKGPTNVRAFFANAEKYFIVDKANDGDPLRELKNALFEISTTCQNELLCLHFCGHGIIPTHGNITGIEFVTWKELASLLIQLKQSNTVYVNMMSVCFSREFESYGSYNRLWYTKNGTGAIEKPIYIYNRAYINDFDSFKYMYDEDDESGYSISER